MDLPSGLGDRERRRHPPRARPQIRAQRRGLTDLGFMHVADVNGDGRNDVIAAAGHDYGVFWFEQGEGGKWTRRQIDIAWSQGHASTLVDLNGDKQPELRHGQALHGPQRQRSRRARAARRLLVRGRAPRSRQAIEWVRHIIDFGGRMGGGMQIPVVDIDGDGDLDVIVPERAGCSLLKISRRALRAEFRRRPPIIQDRDSACRPGSDGRQSATEKL